MMHSVLISALRWILPICPPNRYALRKLSHRSSNPPPDLLHVQRFMVFRFMPCFSICSGGFLHLSLLGIFASAQQLEMSRLHAERLFSLGDQTGCGLVLDLGLVDSAVFLGLEDAVSMCGTGRPALKLSAFSHTSHRLTLHQNHGARHAHTS